MVPPSPRLAPTAAITATPTRQYHVVWYLLGTCFTWAGSLICTLLALYHTSSVRVTLFASLPPLLLLADQRFIQKKSISWGEVVGVCVAITGVGLTLLDAKPSTNQWPDAKPFMGDCFALSIAFWNTADIKMKIPARRVLPPCAYSILQCLGCTILISIASLWMEGSSVFGLNTSSLTGWASRDFVGKMILFGSLIGLVGAIGINFAVVYINPIVLTTTGNYL